MLEGPPCVPDDKTRQSIDRADVTSILWRARRRSVSACPLSARLRAPTSEIVFPGPQRGEALERVGGPGSVMCRNCVVDAGLFAAQKGVDRLFEPDGAGQGGLMRCAQFFTAFGVGVASRVVRFGGVGEGQVGQCVFVGAVHSGVVG